MSNRWKRSARAVTEAEQRATAAGSLAGSQEPMERTLEASWRQQQSVGVWVVELHVIQEASKMKLNALTDEFGRRGRSNEREKPWNWIGHAQLQVIDKLLPCRVPNTCKVPFFLHF